MCILCSVKVLLIIVGAMGALLFARAAKFGPMESEPLSVIIAWAISIAALISAVWLAKLKFAAWAAIFGAMAIVMNVVAPIDLQPNWIVPMNITCGVLCAACVVRNWE